MILSRELEELFSKEELFCFETEGLITDYDKVSIALKKGDISELIRFCKVNNIKNVFYTYGYYDKVDFIIGDEFEEELEEEIYSLMQNDIKVHNKQVEKIDFSRPNILIVFTIFEGYNITFIEDENWIEEHGVVEAYQKIEELKGKYEEKIYELEEKQAEMEAIEKAKKEKELKDLREEFKEFLLNDDEFKMSTNQRLRRSFSHNLFKRTDTKKYEVLFEKKNLYEDSYYVDITRVFNFVEVVWREYKSNLY
ncbi:hypothetical protein [Clostridium sp. D46t1_190503_E9]|uniref:hypothetical protein n=1 Tax=Clostridium sp. D46t1_190503_E9 TaxID=2787137 RepID=UPI00189A5DCD|nr:hypothetical protein [Clostridium sp. D46t1_190503_E9]